MKFTRSGVLARLKQAMRLVDALWERVYERINAIPQNPRVRPLSHHAFVISSRDLGQSWSPEHHDFWRQAAVIVQALKATDTPARLQRLHQIVAEGKVYVGSQGARYSLRLHADVVAYLRELLDEESKYVGQRRVEASPLSPGADVTDGT